MQFRFIVLLCSNALLLTSGAALAQAPRTWVSGLGDDANPCSRTAPCKTFAGAYSRTAAGGEISVLDAGGYGTLSIGKSISIVAVGVEGSILASGTNGINVNGAASDVVSIRGLSLEGLATGGVSPGLNGISVNTAGAVQIEDCVIRGFSQVGIAMQSGGRLHIRHTSVYQNGTGLSVTSGAVLLEDSSLDDNKTSNATITGTSTLVLSNSSLLGGTGITESGAPTITSYGNNRILGTPTITNHKPLQ